MTVLKLLSKKRISRALFKVCRINGFDTLGQIETYYSEHRSFDGLQWCGPEEKNELLALIDADVIRLASEWKIPTELLESSSLVGTADFLLNQDKLLHLHQMTIFKESLRIYQGTVPLIPSEMAQKLGISQRYIKGRRRRAISGISKKFETLQPLKENLLLNYNLNPEAALISIDEASSQYINSRAGTNFTPQFLGFLFSTYLKEQFVLLGEPEEVLAGNFVGIRHYWTNFYLVRKELGDAMDFEGFVQEAHLLSSTSNSGRPLLFKTLISYFARDTHSEKIEAILPVAQEILLRELGHRIGMNGELIFEQHGKDPAYKYPYEALEQLGFPSNPEAIRGKMNELFPQVFVDPRAVKSLMKSKWGFTNHRQVYGLKKWEHQRAGTGIIEEPLVLEEIERRYPINSEAHWQEHWETTLEKLLAFSEVHGLPKKQSSGDEKRLFYWITLQEQRIREGKLQADRHKRYKDFRKRFPAKSAGFWDLHWHNRFEELQAFGKEYGRLPRKTAPPGERRIYNWFSQQRFSIQQGRLDAEKQRQISLFANVFTKKSRTHWERIWDNRFMQLNIFVQSHSRFPKQDTPGEEHSLGTWFRRQLRQNKQGKLKPYQKLQLESLCKIDPPKPAFVQKELWEKHWAALQAFAEENQGLPRRNSGVKEEQALYSWLNIQYTRANKGKLNRKQKARIIKLKAEYPFIRTVHYKLDWDERLEEVRLFCWKHRRLPGRNNTQSEATLCHWWRNQYRRMKKGRLGLRQKRLLKDLKDRYMVKKKL